MIGQSAKADRRSAKAHWDYVKADESLVELHQRLADERAQEKRDCYQCRTIAQVEPAAKWHEVHDHD